ncbi:hypothetical protein HYALB_00003324 [Hymenoscyphus albidus]|uniref:Uncharacterized protein n=1 Tax=Hymenoscyphus albidus TaxID=595503 RepID=A0A9N9Q3C7_9HELO|nr:hypothetical protein HYALB_00003324 [Hymenoscyphus albidus]
MRLSQEIINQIADCLEAYPNGFFDDRPDEFESYDVPNKHSHIFEDQKPRKLWPSSLPPYATINLAWKQAIERRTFEQIHLRTNQLDLFDTILCPGRRQFLKRLNVTIILPSYSLEACGKFETKADQHANNQHFTQAIENLFVSSIPILNCVASVNLGCGGRTFDASNLVDISLKLPSLESLSWEISETNDMNDPPAISRARFATCLSSCTFPKLRQANLNFQYQAPANHNAKPANLVGDQEYDPVSTAIFTAFSQSPNLTSLTLKGTFDATLLYSHTSQNLDTSISIWPRLEKLDIKLDLASPSGHWYFIDASGDDPEDIYREQAQPGGPDDQWYSDDSEDLEGNPRHPISRENPDEAFRSVPNSRLNPLLFAFAKGLHSMPSLKSARLSVGPTEIVGGSNRTSSRYW